MTTLVIATRNAHKAGEIRAILSDQFRYLTLNDFPAAPAVAEDADSFAGNASKKAVGLAEWLNTVSSPKLLNPGGHGFVLADDSGLEVDALNGAPGVHSARFAALDEAATSNSSVAFKNSPDLANNEKLLRLLKDVPLEKRTARFRCVVAVVELSAPTPPAPGAGGTRPVTNYLQDAGEVRGRGRRTRMGTSVVPICFHGVCEGRINLAPRGQKGFGYDPLFVPVGFQQSFGELGEELKNRLSHRAQALLKLRAWLVER